MRLHDHLSIFCDFRPCVAGCFSGIANAFLCVFRLYKIFALEELIAKLEAKKRTQAKLYDPNRADEGMT